MGMQGKLRVDAHQHCWRIANRQGAWPPPGLAALYRDFSIPDLEPLLRRHGIGRTVLVQSLPSEDDTHYMLGLADRHNVIGAVVGWTDLKSADAPARIAALARHPTLRGLRPMLQDLDEAWIADPALAPAVHAMLDHGLGFDALVLPRHLAGLHTFARRFPSLPIVIDHGAKPEIAHGRHSPWFEDMARLADLPNVHCKLSGLVTEAGPGWRTHQVQSYAADLLALFGAQRLIWGSDWPVLDLASDYGSWLGLCEALLAPLGQAERDAVLGLNACRFYRIAPGPDAS